MRNREIIQALQNNGYHCIRSCGAIRQYRKAHSAFTITVIGSDDEYTPVTVVAWITQKSSLTLMSQA